MFANGSRLGEAALQDASNYDKFVGRFCKYLVISRLFLET